jgi:hypothetical protein
MIQQLIVILIVALAVGIAARMIYRSLRKAGDPCFGCAGCELHTLLEQKRRKEKKSNNSTKPKCYVPSEKNTKTLANSK